MTSYPGTKAELQFELSGTSQVRIAKKYGVGRKIVRRWLKEHGLVSNYFKGIDNTGLKDMLSEGKSPFEIAKCFSVKTNTITSRIKYQGMEIPEVIYDAQTTKDKCAVFVDEYNHGIVPGITWGDPNLRASIIHHTSTHILQSDKLTERIYRIINDFCEGDLPKCLETGQALKFYTVTKGYGNSTHQITRKGYAQNMSSVFLGSSKISQELFWEIYNSLEGEYRPLARFGDLNSEVRVRVNKNDIKMFGPEQTNKHCYYLDFVLGTRNIEFDGTYWHSILGRTAKDEVRDAILESKGYMTLRINEQDYIKDPQKEIQKCLDFLRP